MDSQRDDVELDSEGIPDHTVSPDGALPPRDYAQGAEEHGTTASEQREGEPHGRKLRRELPDDDETEPESLGRLVQTGSDPDVDDVAEAMADEVSDEAAPSAEEAAMHLDEG